MTSISPPSLTIKFGKHKGRTIHELISFPEYQDQKYILWLVKQPWLSADILAEIKDRIPTMTIPFGRHEGSSMLVIEHSDPAYYSWLLKDTRLV